MLSKPARYRALSHVLADIPTRCIQAGCKPGGMVPGPFCGRSGRPSATGCRSRNRIEDRLRSDTTKAMVLSVGAFLAGVMLVRL